MSIRVDTIWIKQLATINHESSWLIIHINTFNVTVMVAVMVMVIIIITTIITIISSRMIGTHKASWGDWCTPRIKVINHYNPLYSIHTPPLGSTTSHNCFSARISEPVILELEVSALHPSLGSPASVHTGACPKSQWAWHANAHGDWGTGSGTGFSNIIQSPII